MSGTISQANINRRIKGSHEMKICIYGAGAIGGYLGHGMAAAGYDVSLIARGPHMQAIQNNGLALEKDGQVSTLQIPCSDDPMDFGPQDFVVVTLKAHSVPYVAAELTKLFHEDTAVVMGVNGVPWWYFYNLGGEFNNRQLESVDPGGLQWQYITPARVVGSVVYPACDIQSPGVIRHIEGDRFSLGEPSGEKTERLRTLAEIFRKSGFKAPIRPRLRDEIWVKLWGNLSFNPISALTLATLEDICGFPETRALARAMMLEAQEIGKKLGVRFSVDVDKRIDGAASVGAHRTSMLQDLEQGRAMEVDAVVTAVQELGKLTEVKTPTIDIVLGLLKLRDQQR